MPSESESAPACCGSNCLVVPEGPRGQGRPLAESESAKGDPLDLPLVRRAQGPRATPASVLGPRATLGRVRVGPSSRKGRLGSLRF